MGRRLAECVICPELIVSSPAKRALLTAQIIAQPLSYPVDHIELSDDLYFSGVYRVITLLTGFDDSLDQIMLFGHNPDITDLVQQLCGLPFDDVPTCAVVTLQLEGESWEAVREGAATLVGLNYPKKAP